MKRLFILCAMLVLLSGCADNSYAQVATTTLPVYDFTARLCEGTGITVTRLVTENVSCLHDYSLSVNQVKAIESAETVVISGAGLEAFMDDVLGSANLIDASHDVSLLGCEESHEHSHDHHEHESDPHIWLAPENAKQMARNICHGLTAQFPAHADAFEANLSTLLDELDALQSYAETTLVSLSCRELITFHDGFAYFAHAFDLEILEAVEEESGSEASAAELKHLITLTREHGLPAVFTERSGSVSAAGVIAAETGADIFELDMAMSGDSYFAAMYRNIDTIKEALG